MVFTGRSISRNLRLLLLASSLCCFCRAQGLTLGLSAASGSPGGAATMNLTLNGSGSQPAAVQWNLGYSTTDFSSVSVTAGPAAIAASKVVSCSSASGVTTCVLWGSNPTPVANGVVASVSLGVSSSTTDTSSQVQLANATSADGSGMPVSTTGAGNVVTIKQPPGLNGFTCTPVMVTPPATSNCTVALTAPAPAGGASIALASSPVQTGVPATLVIPQGATSGSFTASLAPVTVTTSVMLSASYLGVKESFGITVNPASPTLASLSVTPSNLTSGQSGSGTVTLSGPAGAGGVIVKLSSSNAAVAAPPASVTVAQGSASATFSITTGAVSAVTPVTLTASGAGTVTANLTVSPSYTLAIAPAARALVAGTSTSYTVTLSAAGSLRGGVSLSAGGLPSGSSASFSPASLSGPGSSTLTITTSTSSPTGNYTIVVSGVNAGFTSTASATLSIVKKIAAVARWFDLDIGNPGSAGGANCSATTVACTVSGGGADIWGTSDQFNYAYFPQSGNFTVITQVVSMQNTNSWAKAGIMIRQSPAANAPYVFVMVTPGQGVSMQYRSAAGASAINASVQAGPVAPYWLKLVRSGNQFTGYASANGTAWTQLSSVSVPMNAGVAAGLAVTSHNNKALNTASFSSTTATVP